eukprot:GILI01013766.1.p1 GENE.GILI01013766.1~~GILI01013766.1.p1  ORF type:complete len:495 (+),score=95.75 GILI01013766.1:97-1485(+)
MQSLAICALVAAGSAFTVSASSLYSTVSGIHTGTINSSPDNINRVVYVKETPTASNTTEIEVLRKSDATNYNENFLTTYPFATFNCGKPAASVTTKRSPVIVSPQNYMPDVEVGLPISIYFVCSSIDQPLGSLYQSSSFDLGETWTTPSNINITAAGGANGVLLKGIAPVEASTSDPSVWLLPVQTSTCSLTFVVLNNYGASADATKSLQICADTAFGQTVSIASLAVVPNDAANITSPSQRIAIFALLEDLKTTQAWSCLSSVSDCSILDSWSEYVAHGTLATGTAPSIFTITNYGAGSSTLPTSCNSMPLFAIGGQTLMSDNSSSLTFAVSQSVPTLLANNRTITNVIVAPQATPSSVSGLSVVGLPPQISNGVCFEQYAYFVATGPSAILSGTFTNMPFMPAGGDTDNGQPNLAAGITFAIIGFVVLFLAGVFAIGYVRQRNDPAEEEKLEAAVEEGRH